MTTRDEVNSGDEYLSWHLCSNCLQPPRSSKQRLRKCTKCNVAEYHDALCQRKDWKEHKQICLALSEVFGPLFRLESLTNPKTPQWWQNFPNKDAQQAENLWQAGLERWNRQLYVEGMEFFKSSLGGYQKCWTRHCSATAATEVSEGKSTIDLSTERTLHKDIQAALLLSRRLLFCAYCELDGNQIRPGRQRLLQCISILYKVDPETRSNTWDDAWMELILSFDEDHSTRKYAKTLTALGIQLSSTIGDSTRGVCGWRDAFQRPGYIAGPEESLPFIPRESHPDWCRELEKHSNDILEEYLALRKQSKGWHKVGSGARGSGYDDHQVVDGKDWNEFVLFGSGSIRQSAPFTKSILSKLVPEAVSLAQQGGGEVIFSVLSPRTRIASHCGPTNLRWTAHLGLQIPSCSLDGECQIRVGPEWHSWTFGQIVLFDDSFEHEVRNDTDEERVVLLIRLWHPNFKGIDVRGRFLDEAKQKKSDCLEKRYHAPR